MTTDGSKQLLNFSEASITNEINLLRRKLSYIVNPYRRPLSSILPEEREVEISPLFDDIDIEACYERFDSWDGSLSKKKIRDWINQFETTLDQNIAYLLLSKFQFFSKTHIESASQNLQKKLLDLLLTKENLWKDFRDAPKVALKNNEREFKK